MTRVFNDDGVSVPVTVVQVEPNRVTQVRTPETDGYQAVQVTVGKRKANRVNKPMAGHFAKAGVEAGRGLWEFRLEDHGGDMPEVGSEIKVDLFETGQKVDVSGISKGKGFQGVIKRFGVKELPRWHKHRKGSRRIGSRSPTIGAMSEVPQPGQMGFHRRTEYNKRILKIGDNGLEITPAGGFPHYGVVRSTWIMLKGTVMGPPKRPIILRWPIRPPKWQPSGPPVITYISLESKIGG